MRKYSAAAFSLLFFILIAITGFSQSNSDAIKSIITADSLRSGNTKDVFTSFFQLAFNNLTSKNKELNFNSNPFAIMLKSDPSLAADNSYYKYRVLRKMNFNFGLRLDTSYRFNGFSSAIKYALVNKRDSATSKLLFKKLLSDSLNNEAKMIEIKLDSIERVDNTMDKREFVANLRAFLNNKDTAFKDLKPEFKLMVRQIIQDSGAYPILARSIHSDSTFNLRSAESNNYDSLKNLIKKGLLWTVSVADTTYKDQFFFSNIVFKTQLLKGFGKMKPGSNWEYDMQANLNLLDDTLHKGRDLKRTMLTIEPGFDLVLRTKNTDQSFLEFKFSGSYIRQFGSLYANERRDSLTVNATMRIRIINDIWIPLEIKYDPRSGNIFGFLNVRMNLKALGKQGGAKP